MDVDKGSSEGSPSGLQAAHARRWTTFDALRDRNYRWLWIGSLASSVTFQMGTVAQGWLVYELTGSAFALGWVGAGWAISTLLLSLYGGAVADRVDTRDLLIWSRLAMTLNTLTIALLISTGAIRLWHLAVNSLLSGVLFSFMMPASQAIISELVDRETLLNAVSLMVANNCLLQVNSEDELRGRVMSVYMMTWGLMPLGTLPAGAIADQMGVPFVLSVGGGLVALVFMGAGLLSPRVRRLT